MTSRTFQNFDGTTTAEVHALPINYSAGGGAWQPIDTTLASSNKQGFAYANTTNALKSYLPSTANGWVRVEAGDVAISFQPIGASSNAATVGKDTVSFAASSNVATTYQVLPGRLKETLTLSAPGASSFSYNLQLDGLTARQNEDNSVTLTDASGLPALRLSSPWMRDADGRRTTAIQVSLSDAGNGLVYTLTPDAAWLAKAAYPVAIDPTVTYYNGDTTDYITLGDPNDGGSGNYNGGTISFSNGSSPLVALDTDVSSVTLNVPGADSYTGSGNIPIVVTTSYDTVAAVENGSSYPFFAAFGVSVPNTAEHVANFADHSLSFTLTLGSSPPSGTSVTLRDMDFSLSITSIATGWYTFQGNSRHTGRTQYAFSSTLTQQWSFSPTSYGVDNGADIQPSLLAVAPVSSSPYRMADIFAVIPQYYGGSSYGTKVVRVEDTGSGHSVGATYDPHLSQPYVSNSFVPTGTPLVYGGRLFVTGNDGTTGYLIALNAQTLAYQWSKTFGGRVYSSPAATPDGSILLTANTSISSGVDTGGKLYLLTPSSGSSVWTGSSAGTLSGAATYSSPTAFKGYAYAGSSSNSGDNNDIQSFSLTDGSAASSTGNANDTILASLAITEGKLLYGTGPGPYSVNTYSVALGSGGSVSRSGVGGYTFSPFYATAAFYAESHVVTLIDGNGQGVGYNLTTTPISTNWHNSPLSGVMAVRASPLVAGSPSGSARIFLPADESASAIIEALNASTGALQGTSGVAFTISGAKIHSSMAAYHGSIYVLTANGQLYCLD